MTATSRDDTRDGSAPAACPVTPGLSQCLSVVLPLVPIGLAFGWLAAGQGLHTLDVVLMSALGFTGSGQFAWLQLSVQQTPLFVALAILLATNLRYVPMALTARLSPASPWLGRVLGAHLLSDESYALEQGRPDDRTRFWLRAVVAATWVLATGAGTLLLGGADVNNPMLQRTASFAGSCVLVLLASGRLRCSFGPGLLGWGLIARTGAVAVAVILLCGCRWFWVPSLAIGFGWHRFATGRRAS